jgi:glycosyltransferase involved in cell wall biosynthesis
VAGLFDEIVVVDTGSTDRTKQIAVGFGARLFDFAWLMNSPRRVILLEGRGSPSVRDGFCRLAYTRSTACEQQGL